MNIYDFAINFEQENQDFYEQCAENATDEYVKQVFLDLAAEEKRHEEIVRKLKAEKIVDQVESDILTKASKVFKDMKENLPESPLTTKQVDAYKKAAELERESHDFYQTKAEDAELLYVKKAFQELAREEKRHEQIMNTIVRLVNRPNTWLEDAEWYHLEEY